MFFFFSDCLQYVKMLNISTGLKKKVTFPIISQYHKTFISPPYLTSIQEAQIATVLKCSEK